MPFGPFENWNACMAHMEQKYPEGTAEKVCGRMKADLEKGECPCVKEGTKVEAEHAKTLQSLGVPKEKVKEAEKKIATDHVKELPDYYERLKVAEKPDFWSLLKAKRKDETEDYPKWHTAQFYKAIHKADMTHTDTDQLEEKEIKNLRLKSKLSPSIKDLKEVKELQKDDIKKEWGLNIEEMLKSDREFEGTFHKPVIDKENDIIPASAMDKAMDDFMILPTLQEVHTERTVGIIVKAWKTSDDEYKFKGKIKPGDDCDDVWKKIQKGEYDGLSIGGRRIRYSKDCSIPSSIRTTPCVTHRLKLYNVSVCSSPVNPEATVDSVAKAEDEVVFDLTETLIKAESTELNSIRKGESMADETAEQGVSKSDDELITKSDIAELTKAVEMLNKSFAQYFASLTTPQPQKLSGRGHSVTNTMQKGDEPDSVQKDEDPDPDEDPEPRRMRKSFDEVDEIEAITKSFDAALTERDNYIYGLEDRIAKMEDQKIQKGGTAVIIPDQLAENDPLKGPLTNISLLEGRVVR